MQANASSPTTKRDEYYKFVLESVEKLAKEKLMSGAYFSSWSDKTYPNRPGETWIQSDSITGDTPDTKQGLYSVYENDTTVADVIADFANRMKNLPEKVSIPGYVTIVFIAVAGCFVVLIAIFVIISCRAIPAKRKLKTVSKTEEEEKMIPEKLK